MFKTGYNKSYVYKKCIVVLCWVWMTVLKVSYSQSFVLSLCFTLLNANGVRLLAAAEAPRTGQAKKNALVVF